MEQAAGLGAALDWKTSLQELSAATGSGVPEYDILEDGPDHEKVFTATAVIGGEGLGHGTGHSKKEAEQQAAAAAWTALRERFPELTPEPDLH
jgi:ribonuclease-3